MQKRQKMPAKLERHVKEKRFLEDLNENLLKNQEIWKAKLLEVEESEKKALRMKDDKIQALEEQLRDLMAHLEAEKAVERLSISNEINGSNVLAMPLEPSLNKEEKYSKNQRGWMNNDKSHFQ